MNKKSVTYFIFSLFLLTSANSCHDTFQLIKGCCDDPPVHEELGVGWVFIPNVFTPNGDGIHDEFRIYGDSLRQVIELKIKGKDGLIVLHNLHLIPDSGLWNGTVNGKVITGLYTYEITMESIDRTVKTFKGKICNCPCDGTNFDDFVPIRNCEFDICDPSFIDCDEKEYLSCFQY